MAAIGQQTHPFMSEGSYRLFGKTFNSNIVLVVGLLSFAPMFLVSLLVLDQFSHSHQDKLYAHLIEVVHKHTQSIDGFLNERINNLIFLSETCGFENLTNDTFLEQRLLLLKHTYGSSFEDLGIVNENGVQEYYAGRFKLEKAQYADTRWYSKAFEKQYYISDVFLGLRSSPHFIVSVKHTIENKSYLLKATINFEAFNSLAENLRIGNTGFAFILNKEGEFQTKPHYDMLPTKKTYQDFLKFGKQSKYNTYVGTLQDTPERGEIIYVAALLKDGDWMLVYQQDRSEAFEELTKAQITAGVVIFFGALIIVLMNTILFHKVIGRIKEADQEKNMMNRQVIETGKLASVGELAAGIAHEINNPVAIMVQEAGWIDDLLEEEDLKKTENLKEFKRSLKQVETQGKRCKEITHKLLSFARKTSSAREDVNVNDIIKEVVSITDMAPYTKVSINTDLAEKVPTIYASPTEIQQVILNFINNALHALEKTGGEIKITSRLEEYHVLIIVEDNGPGIPETNLDRIFDPFFTTKAVGKGTGLGLSICYGIIKKMDGEIDVHSVVDKGTRFEIRLPLDQPKESKTETLGALTPVDMDSEQRKPDFVFKRKIKLLLVDDEVGFVKIMSKRLGRRNIDVHTTLSGEEAIQALRKVDFDVAILDLKMEDMDGLEVLKIFKKMYPKMQVIILSGHEADQIEHEVIKLGAFAYLAKPCNLELLVETLKKAVHK